MSAAELLPEEQEVVSLWLGGPEDKPYEHGQKMAAFLLELPPHVQIEPVTIRSSRELETVKRTLNAIHDTKSQRTGLKDSSGSYYASSKFLNIPQVQRANGVLQTAINRLNVTVASAIEAQKPAKPKARVATASNTGRTALREETGSDEDWMALALCNDRNRSIFFPNEGGGVEIAKRICQECVVKVPCLEYALQKRIDHGVWGGTSERERRRIFTRRRLV